MYVVSIPLPSLTQQPYIYIKETTGGCRCRCRCCNKGIYLKIEETRVRACVQKRGEEIRRGLGISE